MVRDSTLAGAGRRRGARLQCGELGRGHRAPTLLVRGRHSLNWCDARSLLVRGETLVVRDSTRAGARPEGHRCVGRGLLLRPMQGAP